MLEPTSEAAAIEQHAVYTALTLEKTLSAAGKLNDAQRGQQTARRLIESYQWALGDALIEEIGPPGPTGLHNGSGALLQQAVEACEEARCPYSYEQLRDFRAVAHAFSRDGGGRPPAFSIAKEANNPETYATALEEARRRGRKLSVPFIRNFKKEQKERAERDRDRNNDGQGNDGDRDVTWTKTLDKVRGLTAKADELLRDIEQRINPYQQEKAAELRACVEPIGATYQRIMQQLGAAE